MYVDPHLDAVVVEPGVCPECGIRPAGPPKMGNLCNPCRKLIFQVAPSGNDLARAAQQERAQRELCRRHLIPYTQRLLPDYDAGWFHIDLAARLERFLARVIAKVSPRLMLWCPPRHGKSELSSKKLISWALGLHPWMRFICATHTDRLALDNSRDVLEVMKSPLHLNIFPDVSLAADSQGAMGWRTAQGGAYKPVGVGAGIAGYGAHVLNIDDPHKDQEAYSAAKRAAVYRWYKSSARTRLLPGGGILIIQTRWVHDDLSGRVLEEEGRIEEGGKWEVVHYPAQATHDEHRLPNGRIISVPHPRAKLLRKKGEFLHPVRYDETQLAEAMQDDVVWQALYQGDPTAGEAGQFTEEMFEVSACKLADIPAGLTRYQTWDTAQGVQHHNDFSVGITGGVDEEGTLWLEDVTRDRWKPDDLIEVIIDGFLEYRADLVGIEKTQFVVGLRTAFERRLDERGVPDFPLYELDHGNKDKVTRAGPIKARMRRGKVKIPIDAPWFEDFKSELLEFFGGKNDDQVDAFAYLGQLLLEMTLPQRPRPEVQRKSSWRTKPQVKAAMGKSGANDDWRAA